MAAIKEIRNKIRSVRNTHKITKAMGMVAASKVRKAQDRMRAGRPHATKVRAIVVRLMETNPDYRHPYMVKHPLQSAVGIVVVATDKGLCGGLNTNVMLLVLARIREFAEKNVRVQVTAFGAKAVSLFSRINVDLVSQEVHLGDKPNLERLIGALKVQLDDFINGKIDAVYLATSRFINTMKQDPCFVRLLPLPGDLADPFQTKDGLVNEADNEPQRMYAWDYIYEPDAREVIDDLLLRYVEGLVYQAVAENMASEQSARMMAMKAASDNAKKIIDELELLYNKMRQAAITTEILEIVAGAAAV